MSFCGDDVERSNRDRGLDLPLREWSLRHQREILRSTTWMGVEILKNPLDAWVYQELLWRVRPDVLVEIGSHAGGGTLFLANMLDLIGAGEVISVDVTRERYELDHKRVHVVTGDSGSPDVVAEVSRRCVNRRVMVIHDGDHRHDAVLRDLRHYAPLVSVGSYLIVEDGIIDLFPVGSELHPRECPDGPLGAIEEFLATDGGFEIDIECERYLLTWNPTGFLRRVR